MKPANRASGDFPGYVRPTWQEYSGLKVHHSGVDVMVLRRPAYAHGQPDRPVAQLTAAADSSPWCARRPAAPARHRFLATSTHRSRDATLCLGQDRLGLGNRHIGVKPELLGHAPDATFDVDLDQRRRIQPEQATATLRMRSATVIAPRLPLAHSTAMA